MITQSRFLAVTMLAMVVITLTGWANAAERKPAPCQVVETLVTTPDGAQHIARKVRCVYTSAPKGEKS